MYELKIIEWFSAGHFLRQYRGKCENLHGHNWKVEVIVSGKNLGQADMLIDFSELKKILQQVLQQLDHRLLNEVKPFDRINPTAENIAAYIFNQLIKNKKYFRRRVRLKEVRVWENETCCAVYYE